MSPPQCSMLDPNGSSLLQDPILGIGRSGVVVLRDERALKLLYRVTGCSEDDNETLEYESYIPQESIEHVKEVYRRLEQCDGIVPCLDIFGPRIQMTLMENGKRKSP
ncbi:hypothetical protein EMCG_09007 [[Emmonsia] crescens]|uniref:Uncharacterized protein n=1 Tax=[Emmonsia] crescens TaxID=73230 RepID=A0A0G2JA55_9EURO|nr:hypothetical protein EMCG_09007 [Emmonsia crescens UAMH 3008]